MKEFILNSLNQKNQNGNKNPIPEKEFTPNGVGWVRDNLCQLRTVCNIPIKFCL